jgi:hypothetical protein
MVFMYFTTSALAGSLTAVLVELHETATKQEKESNKILFMLLIDDYNF